MTEIKKRVKKYEKYSKSLKRRIAKEYLAGRASYAILAEENGLRDKTVVREFVKWYRQQLDKESADLPQSNALKDSTTSPDKDSAASIKELQEALRLAELKNELLETMIDIAEEKFEVPIRKKSGAKPSKK